MLIGLAIDTVVVVLGYGGDEDQDIGEAILFVIYNPNSDAAQSLHCDIHSNNVELSAKRLMEVIPILIEY